MHLMVLESQCQFAQYDVKRDVLTAAPGLPLPYGRHGKADYTTHRIQSQWEYSHCVMYIVSTLK